MHRVPLLALVLAGTGLAAFGAAPKPPQATSGGMAAAAKPDDGAGLLAPLTDGESLDLPTADDHVPRPDRFLGYPLGSRFTHWERIDAYLEALAAASSRAKFWEYGRTYEGRPLKLLALSTPENLARLEELRSERLRLAEPAGLPTAERERLVERLPIVVWLAYGVHGNEASSSEAAMVTAWSLVAGGASDELLRHTIVLIDPLVNPDGRERYVHGYEQRQGETPNSRRWAAEHWEPWPGGRQNHYLIDLNRDWAWATQQESRQRIAAYRAWEPQVYVDFHEMGTDASYFFPPSAEPVHPRIDRRIVGWLETFGRANAEAFDRRGWIYFKGENYDLFYPGYGDSYPSLRGAVGMTYEMAGGGRGGVAMARADGSPLTLADRIARHVTTSLTTVTTAAHHATHLLADFAAYRQHNAGGGRRYLWAAEQPEGRALADLLTLHGIKVEELTHATELEARQISPQPARRAVGKERAEEPAERELGAGHRFAAGTYLASTSQPLGALLEVLMDAEAPMSSSFLERQQRRFEQNQDPEFYDITAWALPLAFNLNVWESREEPHDRRPLGAARGAVDGAGELGYLIRPQGLGSYRAAAALAREHLHERLALAAFAEGGRSYPAGTLFVPRHGNPADVAGRLAAVLAETGVSADAVASSFDVQGISLGSSQMPAVRPVRVGLVAGEGVDATSFGFLWSLLDRQVGLNHDRLDAAHLRTADLAQYDVLILPNGDYDRALPDRTRQGLDSWVQSGGLLIAVGGDTFRWLRSHELTSFKPWKAPEPDAESEGTADKALGERTIATPGAVLATRLQSAHPLALGIVSAPPILVEGSTVLLPSGDPRRDVLVAAPDDPVIAGFAWPEAKRRLAGSLLVGTETKGNGSLVVFAQNPDFRLFWRGTVPLLLNAVMYGTTSGLAGRNP
jgi:hypothetical protein